MHAMSILWAMLFCFGCTMALSSLDRVLGEVPASDTGRVLLLDRLAPRVARGARGGVVMLIGLVGLLTDAQSRLVTPLWVALLALGVFAVAMTRFTLREVESRLIRTRRYVKLAARAILGTGVFALVEALLHLPARNGAMTLCAAVILLAASRVTFVLASAANELIELSGD